MIFNREIAFSTQYDHEEKLKISVQVCMYLEPMWIDVNLTLKYQSSQGTPRHVLHLAFWLQVFIIMYISGWKHAKPRIDASMLNLVEQLLVRYYGKQS